MCRILWKTLLISCVIPPGFIFKMFFFLLFMYLCIHIHKWKYKHGFIIYIHDLHHVYIYIHLSLSHPHHLPTHTLTRNYTHYIDSLPFYELFFFLLSYSPVLTEPWECFALISVCVPVASLPLFCQTCVLFYHEGNTAKRKQFVLGQANLVPILVLPFTGSVKLDKSSELPSLYWFLLWIGVIIPTIQAFASMFMCKILQRKALEAQK